MCVERAIELNGVAVEKNLAAFRWGRAWVDQPDDVETAAGLRTAADDQPLRRAAGRRPARLPVAGVCGALHRGWSSAVAAAGHPDLTATVARHLHQLMAYKDEYEVARLLLATAPRGATFLLHPPLLRSLGMRQKMELRRLGRPDVPRAARDASSTRHTVRRVRARRRAAHRASDGGRVHRRHRRAARRPHRHLSPTTGSPRQSRSRRSPIGCAATST